jgi:O-antigen/teichoic acid export membrane protein
LNPEKYGEIHYFLGIAGIASSVSLFATQNTITVYTAKNVKIQSVFYLISLVVGVISSLIVILIFYRVDTGLIILAYIVNILAIGDLLGKKLFSQYSKFVLTQKVLTLVLGIGFYYIFGADGIIYALALSYITYTIRIYKGFTENKIDFSLMKTRLGFIVNNYMIGLVSGFVGQIDKLIIVPLLGFSPLGNYNLALQVIGVLMTFSSILFKYLLPHDAAGNQNLLLKKFIILIAVGIAVFGIVLVPLIMSLVFPKYLEVSGAVQIMSLGIIPGTVDIVYTSKLLGSEKSKFVLIAGLISLIIMIVGMIVLGSSFGTTGIAITYVLALSIKATYILCINRLVK